MLENPPAEPRRHVLIVEDEPRMGQLLGEAMVELGHQATVVSSAEAGLRSMAEHRHPVVIMDLNLPGMGGIEAIEAIRRKWPDTAAIVLTGFGDLAAAQRAIHLDVVEFLTKPAHLRDLEVALARAEQRLRDIDVQALRRQAEAGPIEADSPNAGAPEFEASSTANLRELERRTIVETLQRFGGNRKQTADALGISVRTLYYRLKEYRIER